MSSDQARRWIETMKDTGLYHEDIFGVTLKHQEVTTRVRTAVKKYDFTAIFFSILLQFCIFNVVDFYVVVVAGNIVSWCLMSRISPSVLR